MSVAFEHRDNNHNSFNSALKMMIKALVFAAVAVVVLAEEYKIPDNIRDQFKEHLKKQCDKVGAGDKTTEVENAIKSFAECAMGLVNVDTLKQEIEEAKPNGALDEVFKKYCAKSPQLKACIQNLLDGVAPCAGNEVRDSSASFKNATDQLIDFVCYKDGDRIALFIAENGPQCFQDQSNSIRTCIDSARESLSDVEAVKALTMADRCSKFQEVHTCVVSKLEACSTPTPANMVDSLLTYIKKSTPCKDIK